MYVHAVMHQCSVALFSLLLEVRKCKKLTVLSELRSRNTDLSDRVEVGKKKSAHPTIAKSVGIGACLILGSVRLLQDLWAVGLSLELDFGHLIG